MNRHGLYSRAAQIIRSLPQEKGTAEQMIGAAKKLGLKQTELEHAKPPTGPITREALAKHFEDKLPNLVVSQYGENPSFMSREESKRFRELQEKQYGAGLSDEERTDLNRMMQRVKGSPHIVTETVGHYDEEEPAETQYGDYTIPGGKNYRERLIQLGGIPEKSAYHSSHWSGHPNVLAHIRLSDRNVGEDRETLRPIAEKLAAHFNVTPRELGSYAAEQGIKDGIITPEEGASLSRLMRWQNGLQNRPGIGKRLLHVEELQSDWAQEGRDQGFHDPENPYEVFNTKTGETISKHPTYEAMWDAFRSIPEDQAYGLDYGHAGKDKSPAGPYVTNTQHWTDLALKNVLREAAMGQYDGVVFTPGQAQADRYGLEKTVDSIKYFPEDRTLSALQGNSTRIAKPDVDPEDLPGLIGKELAEKLLHPDSIRKSQFDGSPYHMLQGDEMKVGGQGMKGYYDQIVPKSVMRLAQAHDPEVKPGEPIQMRGDSGESYQGFHLPMTETMRNSILDKGFPAMKRGGRVGFAQGGKTDEGSYPQARTEEGELPVSGGVRGGAGLLQAQGEAPLEGLPQNVRIPLTGEMIQAGPDPRIRGVARSYMEQAGLPYNPPTKYAKVDPARAKRIAAAYEDMPHNPNDPLTRASYDALVRETMAQYNAAKAAGFKAEFWHPDKQEDPYMASPRLAVEDVRKNHHMWVFPTLTGYGSGPEIDEKEARENPMLQLTGETWNGIPVTVNDIFRAVHDYYGHAKEGVGFRHDGEENAWRAHASMFSPLARLAMTTETRGQNSWLNFGPHGEKNQTARTEDTVFAPQKIGILPHWAHHEGAEDFMTPEDVSEMMRHRSRHSSSVDRALALTRSFTKR